MESYVEISFLHNMMSIVLSTLFGQYAAMQPVSLRRTMYYASCVSGVGVFCWFHYSVYVMLTIELLCFFFFFRYAYKTYICSLITRYLLYATSFLLYGGGFHNGVWFVPLGKSFVHIWVVYALCFLLLYMKWKDIFAKLSYVYETSFYVQDKKVNLKAYLDSGNLITYKGTPVIFVDKKYHEYFENERIELIVMNTISSTDVMRCYECEIKMLGCKKHKVYINAERHLKLPFECVVLLNMNMMTMG